MRGKTEQDLVRSEHKLATMLREDLHAPQSRCERRKKAVVSGPGAQDPRENKATRAQNVYIFGMRRLPRDS